MERTESKVIQVSPDAENTMIHEMQRFGWNLHGRQEINETGDAGAWADSSVEDEYFSLPYPRGPKLTATLRLLARVGIPRGS